MHMWAMPSRKAATLSRAPLDDSGVVAQAYDVMSGIPVTFFIDSNGIIKNKQDGKFANAAAIETRLNSY